MRQPRRGEENYAAFASPKRTLEELQNCGLRFRALAPKAEKTLRRVVVSQPELFWLFCDRGIRISSLALYMAEKAVRRVVVVPSQPELFRLFCDGVSAEVEKSGWVLRYATRALPAIGFIGTVRGIMVALPNAQGIFGTTGPSQLAAMSDVTEPLGLAFATTLIALVAGLLTGLIGDWEITQEQRLLSHLEDALIDRIDPAEQ